MSSPDSSPQPVSALRHKFENLAHHLTSNEHLHTSEDSHHHHLHIHHSRHRTHSNGEADMQPPSPSSALRPALSSSDLKALKRPPPPPPNRGLKSPVPTQNVHQTLPSPSSSTSHLLPTANLNHRGFEPPVLGVRPPSVSPLLRPVPIPSTSVPALNMNGLPNTNDRNSPLLRKPPPPPPPSRSEIDSEDSLLPGLPVGGVASLRSKFSGPSGSSAPSLFSSRPKSANRIVSHSSAFTKSPPMSSSSSGSSHGHRNSLPNSPTLVLSESPDPLIDLSSPVTRSEMDLVFGQSRPPPLPSRSSVFLKEEQYDIADVSSANTHSRSITETEYSSPPPQTRPHIHVPPPPPRPPPRGGSSAASSSSGHSSGSEITPDGTTPTLQLPPPLPIRRRSPSASTTDPRRPHTSSGGLPSPNGDPHSLASASFSPDRKIIGSGKVAPPPKRSIQQGEKLPPARQEDSSSESREEEKEELKGSQYMMPDSSRSSRRLPLLRNENFASFSAHVSVHVGVVAVAGNFVVVAAHHSVKIYDLSISDSIVRRVELHEMGLELRSKDPRVTCMEFRSTSHESDRGCILWLGTKDGHLCELDVRTGDITGIKASAHSYPVTNIFRYGTKMITLDENGKMLVFSSDQDGVDGEIDLETATPRVVRVGDKQGFARMFGGLLWTSGGPGTGVAATVAGHTHNGQSNGGSTPSRGPTVRVYDIMSQSCPFKSLLPSEYTGAVTSGTMMASQPDKVFLGHEGGYISVWALKGEEGFPVCIEVVKVSVSDVLCLEGINDRLWAGGRRGNITTFDVTHSPWIVTNSWIAHSELPVHTLLVDPYSIEKCGQLSVISVGRDEQLQFWDGCLGLDWIANNLLKHESSFSTFRDIKVLIVSWNVDAAKPDTLNGSAENVNFLDNVLRSVDSPDIIAFGFQELIDLENHKMTAKTVLLGSKKKASDGTMSEKVSRSYKMWHDKLVLAVRLAMPPDCPYTVVHAENLVGLFSCIFAKQSERSGLKDSAITTIKRGMMGYYGNKGCVVARFVIDDSSICFINCHLAAGQRHVRTRNSDVAAIVDDKMVLPQSDSTVAPVAYVGGGDGSMVLDHEIVFLNGDLNYRIDQRREAVLTTLENGDISPLLGHDQLLKEMKLNRAFRLRSFVEPPITFLPTYKYDPRSSDYDTSSKGRVPAWCDRVLYHCRESSRVENLHYKRYEANISDHRPISAGFRVSVKSIKHDARTQVRKQIEQEWYGYEQELLFSMREFYVFRNIL